MNFNFVLTYELNEKSMFDGLYLVKMNGSINTVDGKENIYLKGETRMEDSSAKELEEYTSELYEVFKDDNYYTYEYTSDGDNWVYNISDKAIIGNINSDDLVSKITSSKEVTSDKEGYKKYDVTLDIDFIKELVTYSSDYNNIADTTTSVYVKDNKVAIVIIDTKFNSESVDSNEDQYKITLELSNYGETKEVEVPENVIKAAKEEQE